MRKLFLILIVVQFAASAVANDIDPFADNWYCIETAIFSNPQVHPSDTEGDFAVEQITSSDLRTYSRPLLPLQPNWIEPSSALFDYVVEEAAGWWMANDQPRSGNKGALWRYPSIKNLALPGGWDTSITPDNSLGTHVESAGFNTTGLLDARPPTIDRAGHQTHLSQLDSWLASTSYIWHTGELSLDATVTRLRRGGYRIIDHGMWLQPVPDRSTGVSLLLQLGERADSGIYEVEGTLSVTRGRYLHFDVKLWMSDPESPDGEKHSFIELRESRRMRSSEIHYLDHPALGMLVKVVPAEVPELAKDLLERMGSAPDDVEEVRRVPLNSQADSMMLDWSIASTCRGIYD